MSSPVKIWRESQKKYHHLGKRGKIISFTQIQTPVKGFEKYLPYFSAIIELEDGQKVTGQLVVASCQLPVASGDKVVGILRRLKEPDKKGVIEYGVKWKVLVNSNW